MFMFDISTKFKQTAAARGWGVCVCTYPLALAASWRLICM